MARQNHQAVGSQLDCISLHGIHALGIHGVLDSEHHNPQDFNVDVSLWFDSREAARSDDLALTVDYSVVAEKVQAVLLGKSVALIERLADAIAMSVLEDERITSVEVTVHKPHAPLQIEFQDVSIQTYRTREDFTAQRTLLAPELTVRPEKPRTAVLALGANLGNPVRTLREVIKVLKSAPELQNVVVSPLARTRPVLEDNQAPQPDYYNAVIQIASRLSAAELLELAHHLEQLHHRERPSHWAPRTLDVDIITVEGVESADPRLTLPHPRAATRAFVLVPWQKLDRDARLGGKAVSELAKIAQDKDGIVNLWPDWLENKSLADESTVVKPQPPVSADENVSILGTPGIASSVTGTNYGLPSWKAALGNTGENRVVDDVTGDIFTEESDSSTESNHREAEASAPNRDVSSPRWHRVGRHGAR